MLTLSFRTLTCAVALGVTSWLTTATAEAGGRVWYRCPPGYRVVTPSAPTGGTYTQSGSRQRYQSGYQGDVEAAPAPQRSQYRAGSSSSSSTRRYDPVREMRKSLGRPF
ncbi:hypothetical protein [Planctomicrobium sp. SH664]|uniref:hypothetical protein n=1 Tax=Planctomicrobium sp. SH664 TaxID=3448125 RepID=UPI003F5BF66D